MIKFMRSLLIHLLEYAIALLLIFVDNIWQSVGLMVFFILLKVFFSI